LDGGLQKNSDWPVTTQAAVVAAGGRRATERGGYKKTGGELSE